MLIQHILTGRIFRKIFDVDEFMQRNNIAAEIEEVAIALTSRSFSRDKLLKELDRFYVAIEAAADTIPDFSEKQKCLNTVYEQFFQGFAVERADTPGIVYTPQEIVDFMLASLEEILRSAHRHCLRLRVECEFLWRQRDVRPRCRKGCALRPRGTDTARCRFTARNSNPVCSVCRFGGEPSADVLSKRPCTITVH